MFNILLSPSECYLSCAIRKFAIFQQAVRVHIALANFLRRLIRQLPHHIFIMFGGLRIRTMVSCFPLAVRLG